MFLCTLGIRDVHHESLGRTVVYFLGEELASVEDRVDAFTFTSKFKVDNVVFVIIPSACLDDLGTLGCYSNEWNIRNDFLEEWSSDRLNAANRKDFNLPASFLENQEGIRSIYTQVVARIRESP